METVAIADLKLNGKTDYKIAIDNGLAKKDRREIAESLQKVLADHYMLMLKTHNYHWNVRGREFYTIHNLTEEQYTNLFEAVDVIAERIRGLGYLSAGTFADFNDLSTIEEGNNTLGHEEMLADLIQSHEEVQRTLRPVLSLAADKGDEATADLMTERLRFHEKATWMLRSLLEG